MRDEPSPRDRHDLSATARKGVSLGKVAACYDGDMGLTYITATVSNKKKREDVRFLVDSGSMYTLLPEATWKALALKPKRKEIFSLADGTTIERAMSECYVVLPALGDGHTPVILGEAGDGPLLGVITLEQFGLMLNPFNRTLQPMRMILA